MRSKAMEEFVRESVSEQLRMTNVVEYYLNSAMEIEAEDLQNRLKRLNGKHAWYRNGYRDRKLQIPCGEVHLRVPVFRHYPFRSRFVPLYKRIIPEVETEIRNLYENGISAENVQKILETRGIHCSSTTVSRFFAKYDELIDDFLHRKLMDPVRYVMLDATYFSIQRNGSYLNRPLLLAIGVGDDGIWHVLGAKLVFEENYESWKQFLRELQERWLTGVQLVITDLRNGVREAVRDTFGGVSFQVCCAHLIRRAAGLMSKADRKKLGDLGKGLMRKGKEGYDALIGLLAGMQCEESVRILTANREYALAYRAYPRDHWKVIYTSNLIENVNSQLKRRTGKIGGFPSESAAMRMIGTLLKRIDENRTIRKLQMVFPKEDTDVLKEGPVDVYRSYSVFDEVIQESFSLEYFR